MKPPKPSLEESLLLAARNKARSLWSIYNVRSKKEILKQAFGKEVEDESLITFKDIDRIYEEELGKLKESQKPAINNQQITNEQPVEIVPPKQHLKPKTILDRESPYNPKLPGQTCNLLPKQIEAAKYIFDSIVLDSKYGIQLIGATGVGKTFVMGSVFKNLFAINFFAGKSVSPWPIVCITKASIVEKTKRELLKYFSIEHDNEVKVINIDQLRATFGEMYIKEETIVQHGEAHTVYTWKPNIHPCLFWWDENQVLKNDSSQQSRIGAAVNDIHLNYPKSPAKIYQVFASATPWTRVAEGKCFALSTRKKIHIGLGESELTSKTWPSFSKTIAAPADPYEYSPSAMERFVEFFDEYIHTMKNVYSKFHAKNSVQIIQFRTAEERSFYEKAMERYEREKAKLEGEGASFMCILTELLKFRQAAEYIRTEYIADWIHVNITQHNTAPVVACCFKETINRICWWLHKKYNYSRADISIIWGGNTSLSKADKEKFRKAKQAEAAKSNQELMALLNSEGIDLDMLGLNLSEAEKIVVEKSPEELDFIRIFDLGTQNPKQRQREVDNFQYGKSKCCLFTFKAGGVGLSLHHEFPYTKQRTTILTPTYSAMELVQGMGRCPRVTSLSDTSQIVVFYAGTIEVHVAQKVSQKLKCLQKAVRQREQWDSIILGEKYSKVEQQLIEDTEDEEIDVDITLQNEEEEGLYIDNPYINNLLL